MGIFASVGKGNFYECLKQNFSKCSKRKFMQVFETKFLEICESVRKKKNGVFLVNTSWGNSYFQFASS